jgi:hypothetical protein
MGAFLGISAADDLSGLVFVDNASALGSSQQALVWDYAGFAREDCCYHEFGSSSSNIAYANFAHESRPRVTCEVVAAAVAAAAVAAKPAAAVSAFEVDEKCPEDEEQQQQLQQQQLAQVQALLARMGVSAKQTTTVVLPSAAAAAILTKREQPQQAVVVADADAPAVAMLSM